MENHLTPNHHVLRIRAVILRIGLILLPALLSACVSLDLHRAAAESGVKGGFRDPSPIMGTFENLSTERFGPKYMRLWELLESTEGLWAPPRAGGTDYGDEVRISVPAAAPGFLEIALLSRGTIRQSARMPYSIHGNYVYLRRKSDFEWLPLGYAWSRFDLAITGNGRGGDLVVLTRYEVQGIVMLVGNAGDCGTVKLRFPRSQPMAYR